MQPFRVEGGQLTLDLGKNPFRRAVVDTELERCERRSAIAAEKLIPLRRRQRSPTHLAADLQPWIGGDPLSHTRDALVEFGSTAR